MGVMTIPEFYQKRFGSRRLRIFGGFVLAAAGILNMGLFLRAGGEFVAGITGIEWEAVKWVMSAMILLVLVKTEWHHNAATLPKFLIRLHGDRKWP